MSRPICCRRIAGKPVAWVFEPVGARARQLGEVAITLDEFEAIRLADVEGMYHEQAAEQMKVSRPTFSRIIDSAHRKIGNVLVYAKALKIAGGAVYAEGTCKARRPRCGHQWNGSEQCCRCRNRVREQARARVSRDALDERTACRIKRRNPIDLESN